MCFFRKPEKPKYGRVVALTLGAVAAVAGIAYFVYNFFFEYKCDYDCDDYLDECDDDGNCECEECHAEDAADAEADVAEAKAE